jgi:hypothetical protein
MEQIVEYYVSLVSGVHPVLWLLIFGLCLVNECIAASIPYVLETTWLMAGVLLGDGEISWLIVAPLVLAAVLGRLAGMSLFYFLVTAGSPWFFRRFPKLRVRLDDSNFSRRLQSRHWSVSLWIALGRLLWLRFPISIVMALSKRYWALAAGVAISALVFEVTFIGVGATVGNAVDLGPAQLLPYFLLAITASFVIGMGIRQLWRVIWPKPMVNPG